MQLFHTVAVGVCARQAMPSLVVTDDCQSLAMHTGRISLINVKTQTAKEEGLEYYQSDVVT